MPKDESRDVRTSIRQILLKAWDPIGIADEPNAHDEYDSYIGRVYELLIAKGPTERLMEYLFEVVDKRMGMSPPATFEHMRPTADALKRLSLAERD